MKQKKILATLSMAFVFLVSGIKVNGLLPGRHKNWTDSASDFVYLSSDMEGAISFCETAEDVSAEVFNSGICCFELNSDFLNLSLLSIDPNIMWENDEEPWCFVYAGPIPYNVLRLCWTEELGNLALSLSERIQSASIRAAESNPVARTPATEISF